MSEAGRALLAWSSHFPLEPGGNGEALGGSRSRERGQQSLPRGPPLT